MIEQVDVSGPDPSESELRQLRARAVELQSKLTGTSHEVRYPLIFEFAGSPKSGKSTTIGILSLFLRRCGFRLSLPIEGASVETPPDLKDDLLAFNVWCGCYAVQNILTRCHEGDPADILILDRGLFDVAVWMKYLEEDQQRITPETSSAVTEFALQRDWLHRESAIFVFVADATTALARERHNQLTTEPGRAMNPEFLGKVTETYRKCLATLEPRLPRAFVIDTSRSSGQTPSFSRIAFCLASKVLDSVDAAVTQELLVIDPLPQKGPEFTATDQLSSLLASISKSPKYLDRGSAEKTLTVQQVVPYGFLCDGLNRVLVARRRATERTELASKRTLLFGGHAEKKDWTGSAEGTLDKCLRREIDEELIGLRVKKTEFLGVINQPQSSIGQRHAAFIHKIEVGGRAAIRRQTGDKEFGRETPQFLPIGEIEKDIASFDPWSQVVASQLLGIASPAKPPGLFGV